MKKFNNKKSVLERGGLMIEALAMLGLIAVVTPTMYKKSAERTMEVEDINTASAIRTYMNGVEALLSANYTELMEKIPEPEGDEPTVVSLDEIELTVPGNSTDDEGNPVSETVSAQEELEKYLPYGYSARDNLFNYGQPTFAVARAGNNLSAYMVFPSKASDEDDGIGQERTVRIASLIGSNGGYIRDGNARGVGGTWSLNDNNTSSEIKSKILGDAGDYSIVTSSIDIVNGAEGMGGDMTKYLQRTAENGEIEKWRNTMRTDIYMGELNNSGHDYDDKTTDGYFSIRNINQLIVGADGSAADDDKNWEEAADRSDLYVNERYKAGEGGEGSEGDAETKRGLESYGLYIADETDDTKGKFGVNAYIAGSLEAAGRRLFTDENELTYHGPKVQLGGMDPDEETGFATKYLITAVTENAANDENADELEPNPENQGKNRVEIMPVSKGEGEGAETNPLIIASDSDLEEVDVGNINKEDTGTKLLLAKAGDKTIDGSGADTEDGYSSEAVDAPKISYDSEQPVPQFPVVVDSNMAVNGVLAAGQLDTQKIRAASISVGSPNINDELKWMDVDEDGVHIHSRDGAAATDDGEGHTTAATAKMQIEVNDDIIAMRASSAAQATNTEDNEPTAHESQFIMDDSGVKIIAQGADGNAATDHSIELTTGANGVRERLENNEITIGSPQSANDDEEATGNNQYRVKYEKGGYVDMVNTTLQVIGTNEDNKTAPIFTVRGNDEDESDFEGNNYSDVSAKKNATFKIAGHGNTVFTSDGLTSESENDNGVAKFLAMGVSAAEKEDYLNDPYNAAVNIVAPEALTGTSDATKRVIFIDLDDSNDTAFVGQAVKNGGNYYYPLAKNSTADNPAGNSAGNPRKMMEGSIYIRRGLIDLAPSAEDVDDEHTADSAKGTVRASRFVANNVDKTGKRIMYKNTLDSGEYETGSNKYDTYMVNPAYTSVMKDIKLTSRFGARLSDILPDFITKRIYISTNSYGEDTATPGQLESLTSASAGSVSEGSSDYASPFLGAVAAPACPPGYGRAITVMPIGFEMGTVGSLEKVNRGSSTSIDVSQAGMLGFSVDATTGGYGATDGVVDTRYESANDLLESQPAYGRIRDLSQGDNIPAQLQMGKGSAENDGGSWEPNEREFYQDNSRPELDGDMENRVQLVGGVHRAALDNGKLTTEEARFDERSIADLRDQTFYIEHFGYNGDASGADTDTIRDNPDLALKADVSAYKYNTSGELQTGVNVSESDEGAYFLVTKDPYKRPLTFQKSTWLKTAATDVIESNGFKSGWKVYMGFIYPKKLYGQFASLLDVSEPHVATNSGGEEIAYWNLFPVLKDTLTGYSTTYCFIDNKDPINGSIVNWDEDTKKAGNLKYDMDDWNTSFEPKNADDRNKYLNDPALKYDEVW